jgi:carboxymethylenebutenolidase
MYQTNEYEGMTAETVNMQGAKGDTINAYFARPLGTGPFPGMVLIHHAPGWDEWYRECARRFAHHGYMAISPNLYFREGQVLGDLEGAMKFLRAQPNLNGKVGVFGTCSGGRQAFLAGCRLKGFDAVVECWGGRVVQSKEELTPKQPVAPIDYTKDLSAPLLGLFGNEDKSPSPEQVNKHEEELKKHGKNYEFHRYDGAGHGFFYYDRANYRQEQAMDGWKKIWAFLEKHLSK